MNSDNMFVYKILKPILSLFYKIWYNPKIIGKENIPKEGSIILVGNHIHIMDQCNIIISTKRAIHFMAKKEYFEGKYACFFKSVGCIPVDRSIKDSNATSVAIEVLENNQALGLFPEGTRNSLKEERIKELYDQYIEEDIPYNTFSEKIKNNKTSQMNYLESLMLDKIITKEEFIDNLYDVDSFLNDLIINHRLTLEEYYSHMLLPFKFGAVSMAKKTNSYLVPYAITGDYKFRSKNLKVSIGKPFQVSEDLEKSNQILEETVKNLIKENLQNNGK